MMILFKLIFITSILVLGYTIVTQENMAFYSIRKWAEDKKEKGSKWVEPILLCHWCQPSSWALLGFGFAFGLGIIKTFEWNLLFYYILTVGGSSLFNGLVWGYHLKSNSEKDRNEVEKEFLSSANILSDVLTENIINQHEEEEYEEIYHN